MRLKRLKAQNFTAFPEVDLTFAKGLNVFVGENGTGKTLLMRLPYAVMRLVADLSRAGELPAKSMLAHLAANGALNEGGCIFWDEPEANLNPALIRRIARAVVDLCAGDVQIFVATHSLFLLRELELLRGQIHRDLEHRYFAFGQEEDGVVVRQAEAWEDVDPLNLLDEELAQSDRYLEMDELL